MPPAISASARSRRSASPPELAERAPGDLNHVYFTLGGSDAVDSTIRFVRYYWNARGKPQKDQFISLEQGYHGSSTVGAGLTALPVFHAGFGLPFDWQHKIPSHYAYRNPVGDRSAGDHRRLDSPRCAPRSRSSAGRSASPPSTPSRSRARAACWCRPTGWMKAMRELCRELDILFVADEVITGFGRTGPLFACTDDDIVPDLMTVAKGLTSGYVPMGAVLHGRSRLSDDRRRRGRVRGRPRLSPIRRIPSAPRSALEVLDLYEGGLLENGRARRARLMAGLASLERSPARRRRARPRHARGGRARDRQGGEDAAAGRRRSGAPHLRPGLGERPRHPRLRATACSAMRRRSAAPTDEIDAIVERTRTHARPDARRSGRARGARLMAVLYLSTPERGAVFARAFAEQLPEVPFWQGRAADPAAVRYLVTWTAPERLVETYPNLRLIFSVGAGVDQFDLASLPSGVGVVRMLEPGLAEQMREYVTLGVLALHRDLALYLDRQRSRPAGRPPPTGPRRSGGWGSWASARSGRRRSRRSRRSASRSRAGAAARRRFRASTASPTSTPSSPAPTSSSACCR